MNVALIAISSLSLVCSAGCLFIMAKTAKELRTTKTKIDRNAEVVKTALSQMEL